MDFDAWTINLSTLSATHESGFSIEIEGNPKDPSSVNPGRFPSNLSGIEQVRLLRHGMEAFAKEATKKASKAKKLVYDPPPNKPKRPVLSLKKREEA